MLYFNRIDWTLTEKPGPNTIGMPVLVALALAPILGASLVLFLPFVGLWLFAAEAWKKARAGFKSPALSPVPHRVE